MPEVASLNVSINAGVAGLIDGFNKADKRLRQFQKSVSDIGTKMASIGGIITGAFAASAKRFASVGDQLDEMATQTGIAVEQLSALQYAASFSSVSLETLGSSIGKMQKNLIGSPKAFEALGLSVSELLKLTPDKQLGMIADAIFKIEDPAKRTAAAMAIFGKGGAAILPFLAEGSSGIGKLTAEAAKLGLVMSGADAKAASALDDALTSLWAAVDGLVRRVGGALAPAVTQLAEKIKSAVPLLVEFIDKHKTAIIFVAELAAGLVALGTVIVLTNQALKAIGLTITIATNALRLLTGPTILMAWANLQAAIGATIALFIANPIALAILGIGSALAIIITATGTWGSVLDSTKSAWSGFTEALQTGVLVVVEGWTSIIAKAAEYFALIDSKGPDSAERFKNWFDPAFGAAPDGNTTGRNRGLTGQLGGEEQRKRDREAQASFEAFQKTQGGEKKPGNWVGMLAEKFKKIHPDKMLRDALQGPASKVASMGTGINMLLGQATNALARPGAPGAGPTVRTPGLIEAGSAEAFQLGRHDQEAVQNKIEENTAKGKEVLSDILKQFQGGIKASLNGLTVINGFAH